MSNGLQPWLPAQDSPEIPVNENFEALSHMATFAKDPTATTGLTWGYIGGRWGGHLVDAGTLALPANSTVYITVNRSTGVISASTSDVNWQNVTGNARVYELTTGTATVTAIQDYRAGYGGVHGITDAPSGGGGGTAMAAVSPISAVSHNLVQADLGAYLRFTATGAKTLTINAAEIFTVSQEFHIANRSPSGDLVLSPIDITLNVPKAGTLTLEPGDTVTIKFLNGAEADVFGSTKGAA